MVKKIISVWLSLLLCMGGLAILCVYDNPVGLVERVSGATIYVNTTGSGGAYTSVQHAINVSNDGDTVYVYSGTYYENVVVDKTINLTGEDRDITIIDGGGIGSVVAVSANWVNVSALTVRNGEESLWHGGIKLWMVENCKVFNTNVSNTFRGIFLWNSNENNIEENIAFENRNGIHLDSSSRNNISSNNFSNNYRDISTHFSSNENTIINNTLYSNSPYGIHLWDSEGNNFYENTIIKNGFHIWGGQIEHWNTHNIDQSNTINGKPVYYLKNQTGGSIPIDVGQVILANCAEVEIENLEITYSYVGILIGFSSNINITNNNVSYNTYGMYISSSSECNITGNIVLSNKHDGIYIHGESNSNIIACNIVTNNIHYGISLKWSSYNRIFHNNLINNGLNVYDDRNNYWNDTYPTGGNYWSYLSGAHADYYSGADTPQTTGSPDGIYDTQYDIDANSTDFYPLKYPWGAPSAPTDLVATAGDSFINVTWDVPSSSEYDPVTNYRVYRSEVPNGESFLTEIMNELYHNDTNVTNGITYYYKVSAKNTAGEGPISNEINATPMAPPYAPQNLQANAGVYCVNLTWDSPTSSGGSPITNYRIYRSNTSGEESFLIEIGNITYFNDTNVTNGITYHYKVSAKNAVGEGVLSNESNATLVTIPTAPTNLYSICGNSYVNMSWSPPSSDGGSPVTNYRIFRGETSGGETFLTEIGNGLYYNDTNVTNGVTYYYKMSAVNAVGEGFLSNSTNATPDRDFDGDGTLDFEDEDDDNDGYLDVNDTFPLNATEWLDTDNDGIGNNADPDDDDDGILDENDYYPLDSTKWKEPGKEGLDIYILLIFLVVIILTLIFTVRFIRRKKKPGKPTTSNFVKGEEMYQPPQTDVQG
ncbi:MAG: fibronectin type III domain-containing protein [Thermoplasmata archaeon]|nr:MAG: fibronectin type III domain-containing protein [Thermoplasmata archaeon]